MKRRELIAMLGVAAVSWPLVVHAQQPDKLPTIGFLGASTASGLSQRTAAFVQRLRELGWIEGRSVAIEYRWAEGRIDRVPEIVGEFLRLKVDVIVTSSTSMAHAAQQATAAIPIVFASSADPVGGGLVASLARPGGNVTGLSVQQTDIAGKRVELLREIVPGLRRLALLAVAGSPTFKLALAELQSAARTLDIELIEAEIRRAEDIAPVIDALQGHADALYVAAHPLLDANRVLINRLALDARLPTSYGNRQQLEGGGLMSYGPDVRDLFRRAGDYVDKILRGAKPADMPIEQPTKWELVINLATAKALGLAIPESFLQRADEVIE